MTLERNQTRQGQQGFTLVELAVVMIIVGLLIGGILKGQELIANAQVTATISQAKGIESAVSTFRDSYRAMPGDMGNAAARLPDCNAPCANSPTPNGQLDNLPSAAAVSGAEGHLMFIHLLKANLLSGFEGTAVMEFGQGLPGASAGGGYYAGFHNTGGLGANAGARGGNYLSLRGSTAAPANTLGAIDSNGASRIDAKMDDAIGNTGGVFAADAVNCLVAADGTYDTANNPGGCNLYIRIQN